MSTNQIEQRADARSAMQRAMEGVRSARGTQPPSNDQAAGFSSLLAAMDGIGGLPALASGALGQALGEDGSAALSALSSLKGAAKDGLKDAADLLADPGLAQGLLQQPQLPLQPQAEPTGRLAVRPGQCRHDGPAPGAGRRGARGLPGTAVRSR